MQGVNLNMQKLIITATQNVHKILPKTKKKSELRNCIALKLGH